MTLNALVEAIRNADTFIAARVGMAVNAGLTLRNWIIGFYIYEYEQHGADRARYGENLLDVLSAKLSKAGIQGTAARTLRLYRQFCIMYPNIRQTLIANSEWQFPEKRIWQTLSAKSKEESKNAIVGTVSAQLKIPGTKLFERLSFSHFAELVSIEDPLKRSFYEIECMRGNWSVRELKRQIGSLYYERSGLSKDKKQLAELAGMDHRLFVSKYQLELPKKAEMERFLEEQMKDIGYGG